MVSQTIRLRRMSRLLAMFALCAMVAANVHGGPDRSRPNVILFYADDMGIGDTSAYADLGENPDAYQIATPNIDRLAALGTRFTDVHSAAAVCTPSRVSILTGRYSFRSDLKQRVVFTGDDFDEGTLFTQGGKTQKTVGNLLNDAGYRTYGVGKWHLGVKTDNAVFDASRTLLDGPTHVGFDRYSGHLGNPGGKGELFVDDQLVKFGSTDPADLALTPLSGSDTPSANWVVDDDDGALQQAKLTQLNLQSAKSYLGDHATGGAHDDQPFFLYYASHANHAPYYSPDAIAVDANGTPASVPVTGNTIAGGPIHVLTGPDGDNDGLPDPLDPQYPSGTFDNQDEGWTKYYQEDEQGKQIDNPAAARADMVHENDIALGELLDYLEVTDDPRNAGGKLIDNTLIIFTSDNGANISGPGVGGVPQASDSQPTHLRGKKGTQWEGGTRIPFIAAWPGEVQSGLTSDALFGQQDLYATLADITEQAMEAPFADAEGVDSESVLDALLGTASGVVRQADLIYKRKSELILRRGNLKLIATESDFDADGERIDPGGATTGLDWQDLVASHLFDLSGDLAEQNNLVDDPAWEEIRDDMLRSLVTAVGPDAEVSFTRGIVGDINHDHALDETDWRIFRAGFGDDLSGFSELAAYKRGDIDGDSDVDVDDFDLFKRAYDLANGAGAFVQLVSGVPEPTAAQLAVVLLLTAAGRRTSRRR